MNEQNPRTMGEALELWDAGELLPVFEVESQHNEQHTLWGAAFDKIAGRKIVTPAIPFTKRERDVIASIVFVAAKIGWREMIRSHIHEKSPAISIRKPGAGPADPFAGVREQKPKQAKSQETDTPAPGSTPGPLPGA